VITAAAAAAAVAAAAAAHQAERFLSRLSTKNKVPPSAINNNQKN
jgi:hypothetical protein